MVQAWRTSWNLLSKTVQIRMDTVRVLFEYVNIYIYVCILCVYIYIYIYYIYILYIYIHYVYIHISYVCIYIYIMYDECKLCKKNWSLWNIGGVIQPGGIFIWRWDDCLFSQKKLGIVQCEFKLLEGKNHGNEMRNRTTFVSMISF